MDLRYSNVLHVQRVSTWQFARYNDLSQTALFSRRFLGLAMRHLLVLLRWAPGDSLGDTLTQARKGDPIFTARILLGYSDSRIHH
ncbi:hypothetical protein AVEN_227772-1 [Araneus ventricosus]|uniref:Uncharacterized protein n=1 Tax=Araneus ventricosus TaxID=182803 RepID=A0A4Y2IWB2_ARAVE|nr:hypothetical protein AVEN_227772-1 [Araneus ventricosus]